MPLLNELKVTENYRVYFMELLLSLERLTPFIYSFVRLQYAAPESAPSYWTRRRPSKVELGLVAVDMLGAFGCVENVSSQTRTPSKGLRQYSKPPEVQNNDFEGFYIAVK
ncbi:hypothetical protein WN944_024402 [Citrus x changshan-huyou]|uniref:Uncharacterized protein n=1 Tax=Citrus x changshan-huyou TaxID=2935761 RepID=A0AAP0QCK7_9ROSI